MRLSLLALILAIAGLASACGGSSLAPSSGTDGGADTLSPASEGSDRGTDAAWAASEAGDGGADGEGAIGDAGPLCNALVSKSPVLVNQLASDPPLPHGGSIADGVYEMTSAVWYTGDGGASGPTGGMSGATLQITGDLWQFDENGGVHTQHNDYLVAAGDSGLSFFPGCYWPQPGGGSDYADAYTATATELSLYPHFGFVGPPCAPTYVETFTKQ